MASADFTIADVLVWARTKPADETYPYWDVCGCAMHQFLVARGLPVTSAGGHGDWVDADHFRHEPPQRIPVATMPHTFGAFVSRLEALLPAEPLSDTWTKADAYAVTREQVLAQ